jgi:hypothetical protein
LHVVSFLRNNPNIRIARDQTIHLVGRDPALVMVFENKCAAVAADRQIGAKLNPDHPPGVRALFGFRNDSIRIGIDIREHKGKYGHARGQSDLRLDSVFLDRDKCTLQVLVEPVRERRRTGQQKNRSRSQPGLHFAVSFRP